MKSPVSHCVSTDLCSTSLAKACWPACHIQLLTSLGIDSGHACTDVDEVQAGQRWLQQSSSHRDMGHV